VRVVRPAGEGGHLGSANDNRGFRWRLGLWSLLIVAWLVTLLYMWTAFATFPSAERLEQSRPMPIPTLGTAAMLAARSAAELGVLLALLWPWWRRWYPGRALLAAVAAGGWFLAHHAPVPVRHGLGAPALAGRNGTARPRYVCCQQRGACEALAVRR
jgi:hypothetical protein